VLLVTFALVIFRDLTEGIVVGFVLGALLFIDRMGKTLPLKLPCLCRRRTGRTARMAIGSLMIRRPRTMLQRWSII
jgi:hypothetical protein